MTRFLKVLPIGFLCYGMAVAQTAVPIPDTLTGNTLVLTMHPDSVAFFPGQKTSTLGFNQFPYLGPTLILNKGQNVSITVNNQIGDTSNVHWHGLHVAPVNDGGPHTMVMDGMAWNPQFDVLDKASTYWYHPHFHGKTAEHAIKGAVGMLIVRDPDEGLLNLPRRYGVDDFPLMIQSAEFNAQNQLMPFGMQDSILLVNGIRANYGHSAYLPAPAQVVRLRLLNASGERTFNFGFSGNTGFKIIGSDGGLLNAPVTANRVRISPGERYEILLDLTGMAGQEIQFMCYGSELPTGVQGGPTMPMPPGSPPMDSPLNGADFEVLKISVTSPTADPVVSIPASLVSVFPIPVAQADMVRKIDMTAENEMSMDGPFFFNQNTFDMERIDYHIPINNTEIWEITNSTMVAHPFHIHDVPFYILDRDGNPPAAHEAGRKDVVMVSPDETVRFITRFETFTDTVVPYVFHCHILMHEDDGMMGQFLVVPENFLGTDNWVTTQALKLYPNPTAADFRIETGGGNAPFDIRLTDMQGRVVYSKNNHASDRVDISGLAPGAYQVFVRNGDAYYASKIVKR